MSRVRVHEVSSPISLFPFIGILLCTMGALMVVLIAVSRSARDSATREILAKAESRQQAGPATDDELGKVKQYLSRLDEARDEANRQLSQDKLRLSQVEDHMRRLQGELQRLVYAANELDALELEHYDDRAQAEREIARLNTLISESKATIEALQGGASAKPKSYALIPYEGPNGTFRRPLYIECLKDEVILQPEGTRISRDDLQPPLGPGNALASAIRAARDHYVQKKPEEGQSRDTEPYPMLIVRPEGAGLFAAARKAIEAADFDFGFEPVESNWKLDFGVANPQVANVEHLAIEQARARQTLLAEAAPRAYSNPELGDSGHFDFDEMPIENMPGRTSRGHGSDGRSMTFFPRSDSMIPQDGDGSAAADEPADSSGGGAVAGGVGHAGNGSGSKVSGGSSGGGEGSGHGITGMVGGGRDAVGGGASLENVAGNGGSRYGSGGAGVDGGAVGGPAVSGSPVPVAGSGHSGNGATGVGGTVGAPDDGDASGPRYVQGTDNPPKETDTPQYGRMPKYASARDQVHLQSPNADDQPRDVQPIETRGKDWALRNRPGRAVPVRRTIRVVVRQDQIIILPGDTSLAPNTRGGKTVTMKSDTVHAVDEFVEKVRAEIDGWGIAGDNLYWRPILDLTVTPDGQQRANDLRRLLKNSGLELSENEIAKETPQGKPHATR
jgi:hypothetical protein